jgi:hypothetical protein
VRQGEFVRPVAVRIGLTDGSHTEIEGTDIQEGTEVVIGMAPVEDGQESRSPFLPQMKSEKKK